MEFIGRVVRRVVGVGIVAAVVLGFVAFLWWTVGAALGLPFPFGVLLSGVILVMTIPVFGYVMYVLLVVFWEWISGKTFVWR